MTVLGFLNAIVELVDMQEGHLLFRSNRQYPLDKQVQVRLVLPPGSGRLTTLTVVIRSCRPLDNGGLLYVADLPADIQATFHSEVHDPALRRAERHALGIRVMSKQLPRYRGMTVDLSRTGLQLELDGPVQAHTQLEMELEFDRFDLPRLKCQGEVVWCRPHPTRDDMFRAGVHFAHNDPSVDHQLAQVADFFEHRAHADLETLLDQAKLLKQEPTPPPPAPKLSPSAAPAQRQERRGARRTTFILPVDATLTAYRWELAKKLLRVILKGSDGNETRLDFPESQTVLDYGCRQGETAKSLRTSAESPLIQQVIQRHGPGPWKHYQFLDEAQQVLLEIVSTQCHAG